MQLISLMKTKNERKETKKAKNQKQRIKRTKRWSQIYCERVRAKCILQLICKASFILKSNLELALSIMFKERQWCKSKYVVLEYKC